MNKKILFSLIIMGLSSCTSIKGLVSFDDPYENQGKKTIIEETKDKIGKKIEKTKEKFIENKEDLEKVEFTETEKRIISQFKKEYNLVDTQENIEKQTINAIIKIRKEKDKNVSNLKVLDSINKVIKETKTSSYVLAVSRVINNWGK